MVNKNESISTGKAFWVFSLFGMITVLLALGGGLVTVMRGGGAMNTALGFLLIFMGLSLAAMLGSLFVIQRKRGT